MKKLIIILAAAAMAGCGIYKPYTRPEEIKTDGLYGQGVETVDTMTLGNISWQEMFTDPYLQQLIQQGLDNNTDLQSAYWRVKEAEATLKSARLAYLPSFNFAPNGGVSSLTNPWNATWTYTVPATASWEVDIFGKLTNSKRRAKASSRTKPGVPTGCPHAGHRLRRQSLLHAADARRSVRDIFRNR